MAKKISEERQAAFYIGTGLMILGGLLFVSVFLTRAANFGNSNNFEGRVQSGMYRALGGMALLFIGGVIRGIGAKGLAGSGERCWTQNRLGKTSNPIHA